MPRISIFATPMTVMLVDPANDANPDAMKNKAAPEFRIFILAPLDEVFEV